jgi:hypothetical protein
MFRGFGVHRCFGDEAPEFGGYWGIYKRRDGGKRVYGGGKAIEVREDY